METSARLVPVMVTFPEKLWSVSVPLAPIGTVRSTRSVSFASAGEASAAALRNTAAQKMGVFMAISLIAGLDGGIGSGVHPPRINGHSDDRIDPQCVEPGDLVHGRDAACRRHAASRRGPDPFNRGAIDAAHQALDVDVG